MKRILPTLALLGLFVACPILAHAAEEDYNRGQFDECDKDRDGLLTKDEFLACWPGHEAAFEKMDRGEGKLTPNDMEIGRPLFSKDPKHAK